MICGLMPAAFAIWRAGIDLVVKTGWRVGSA